MRRVLIIVAIILIPVIPIVLVLTGAIKTKPTTVKKVTLTMWGTEDPATAFTEVIARYNLSRPYAKITYVKVQPDDYLNQLVRAWAIGTGPDIFFVPNTWVGQMEQYALSMPASLAVPVVQTGQGLFKSSTTVSTPAAPAPSLSSLRGDFVDGAMDDVIRDGQVWGLPLAMDTLVIYYNKDLLNNSQIFAPAKTWQEVLTQIDANHLTITDADDNIVQSAIALGTAANVPFATDILSLLFLQNGVPAAISGGSVNLHDQKSQDAFDFYLSFANTKKTSYSWNANQPNARDAFMAGKVAYFIGTYDDRATIAKSGVNWAVTPMFHLQSDGDNDATSGQRRLINGSRYLVPMVAKASQVYQRSTNAWNFLQYMSRESVVKSYLDATGRLAARRALLSSQSNNPDRQIFANQLLTAKSWYRGRDGANVEKFLSNLITSVNNGQTSPTEALRLAADQINATL